MAGLVERPTPPRSRGHHGIHDGGGAARRTPDPAGFRDAVRKPRGLGANWNVAAVAGGAGRANPVAQALVPALVPAAPRLISELRDRECAAPGASLMRRQSLRTVAAALAVALVNIALVSPLFRVEYTDQMQ